MELSRHDRVRAVIFHAVTRCSEDRVILRHEWMDVKRIVHLNLREHPRGGALTTVDRMHVDVARQRLVVEFDLQDPAFFSRESRIPRGVVECLES